MGMIAASTGISSQTPNLVVLFTNEVQQHVFATVIAYGVHNPQLVDLCTDTVFNLALFSVVRGSALMPISGFFGTFQWLCGEGRVLTRSHAHRDNSSPSSLMGAFMCAHAPIITIHATEYDHTRQNFLMHASLSVVGAHEMGFDGFITESYHDVRLLISDPNTHLVWNIFLACSMSTERVAVSEIDTCAQCSAITSGGFAVLGSYSMFFSVLSFVVASSSVPQRVHIPGACLSFAQWHVSFPPAVWCIVPSGVVHSACNA